MIKECEKVDNVILGAGAAGLFLAGELRSQKNLIIEKNSRPGKKIIVSGGGRCNFTNINIKPQDFQTYGKRVFSNVFKAYTQNDFINLVDKSGIDFYEKKLGQLFCKKRSTDILNLLINRINQKKTKVLYNTEIQDFHISKIDDGFIIKLESKHYQCKNLIVACGGPPMPKIGGTNLATRIAQKFNIEWSKFLPALVPAFQKGTTSFSGLSMPVKIKIKNKIIY
ncbi:MAG: aminoacetone oxidase family FAD-binding enzyme, partial [Halobacteriovoraceae bacterium]|nr:aminoacetone oxidase family FAD-binding enzyme [Halobacteriovoraceae bacterium]